jgi:hypothetical protein
VGTPTDSVPRISVRDLFIALKLFETEPTTTLENLRLRFCLDRGAKRKGDYLFPTAVNVAVELQKLGLAETGPLPKAISRAYEASKDRAIRVTRAGNELLAIFLRDRAAAFDQIFSMLFRAHRPLRAFVSVIVDRPLVAPVGTSVKDHVGVLYSSASTLADAVALGQFDSSEPLRLLAKRLGRDLTDEEHNEIRGGLEHLAEESKLSASSDDATEFAKNFLSKFNDIVMPAVFRGVGLPLDYRSHRALWSWGEEFKLWGTVTCHPEYDATVVYRTATIRLSESGAKVSSLVFDSGLQNTRENFLGKLFAAYQKLQGIRRSNSVDAWELRAVFCLDNGCQASVFNTLFAEHYMGDDLYTLHFEIQQKKPQRKEDQLRVGQRSVGAVLITRGGRP